ncbi:MAG: methionyl-tRNA formyltransferase [Planctomycetota bacterium]
MKIAFLGSGSFALPVLDALRGAGFAPAAVVSQPPRRRRRRGEEEPTPVHRRALEWDVPVLTPAKVNLPEALEQLRAVAADLFVVAEYGQILSQALLDIPPLGAINVHGSLLPRWRGATPVEAAIIAGDAETGVAIQRVVLELDAGDVLATRAVPLGPDDIAGEVRERLAALGGELAVEVVSRYARGDPPTAVPQDVAAVTHCRRFRAEDYWLDWGAEAVALERRTRAFLPRPMCRARLARDPAIDMKIGRAQVVGGSAEPGVIASAGKEGIDVGTAAGLLRIVEVVPAGRRAMAARDFVNGFRVSPGERFAAPDNAAR